MAKWKARSSVSDLPTGPKQPRSTVLSAEEEAAVVAFRRHTLLPLDDCLYALQPTIPHLTRSSLLPVSAAPRGSPAFGCRRSEGEASAKRKIQGLSDRLLSYRHRRSSEPRRANSTCSPSPSIRTSKFAFVELHEKVAAPHRGRLPAPPDRRRPLTRSIPSSPTTEPTSPRQAIRVLGAAPDIKAALKAGELVWAHAFEYACAQNDIDHRLTKPKHPWTNGQVERMNRTIKDATVKRYFYETHDQLRAHLQNFVDAYNFARRLKTLRGLTPYEFVGKAWTSEPHRFKLNPLQQMPGLNI